MTPTLPMTEPQFFDWMRGHQANKKLTQDMVDGAKQMIALMSIEELKEALALVNGWHDPKPYEGMTFSSAGNEKLKAYEKFVGKPYRDIAKKWTIGYGNTYYENRKAVSQFDAAITEKRAAELKNNVINMDFAPAVNLMFAEQIKKGEVTQNMFDALILLSYNIGVRGLAGSSVAKYLKAGKKQAAADAFLPWNKITENGVLVFSRGLQNRREKERALFLS